VVRVLQDTNKTLNEFSGTARSIRVLADYLERNPDSLVYGKGGNRR
jgi:paraquat-inducible protein B